MPDYFGVNSAQASTEFESVVKALKTLQQKTYDPDKLNTKGSTRAAQNQTSRYPWVMSTTEWLLADPPKGIAWEINPSDISWNMSQRSTMTKTLIGTVLHVWPNTGRGTFFDEIKISLNLQSGNLMPVRLSNRQFEPAGGHVNFFDFMQLVDAPKLTLGTASTPPRANLVNIQYRSNLFPNGITLIGMFDSTGIKFTDTSADNQVNGWSVDFVVYDTIPKIATFSGESKNPIALAMFGTRSGGLDSGTQQVGQLNFGNFA